MRSLLFNPTTRRVNFNQLVVGGNRLVEKCTLPSSAVHTSMFNSTIDIHSFPSSSFSTSVKPQATKFVGGLEIKEMKKANPHIDVVKYLHKQRTWSVQHVDYYAEALAIGIVENGLQKGDVVLSWLPTHFSEMMVLQFACSKAGLILYNLDPKTAIKDPALALQQLKAALELTSANVFLSQETADDVNYVRLTNQLIPELRIFNYAEGMPFVTPRFPHVRFCIHSGLDQNEKYGWLPLRHFLVPSNNLDKYVKVGSITDETPLAGELILDAKGIPTKLGKTLTNEEVVKAGIWPTYNKILEKEFHVVEGVGVVF